jgi:hypothetical protein
LEEILELGGAISLLSFVTYKPYGVSNFSKLKTWSEYFEVFYFKLLLAGL